MVKLQVGLLGPCIFDMYTSRALLYEELGELHDSRKTSVSGICIRNNRSQIIDACDFRAAGFCGSQALFALLSVVEQLRHKEMTNFVRYSCVGVICQIRTWF